MNIKILTENTAKDGYGCEHGLSVYIETKKHKILFDTGQSDMFISNAARLGVDLAAVDIAVLSHGHYDHGGGIGAFLKVNSKAFVYTNENAFGDFYAEDGRFLGLDKALKKSGGIVLTGDEYIIDDELTLFTGNGAKRTHHMDTFGLFEKKDGVLYPDEFLHEQYLLINENGKKVLVSGCSHKGIFNILDWAGDVSACIGGFHFMKLDTDDKYLIEAANKLNDYNCKFYTCHCTGVAQYEYIKSVTGDKADYVSAGMEIVI